MHHINGLRSYNLIDTSKGMKILILGKRGRNIVYFFLEYLDIFY